MTSFSIRPLHSADTEALLAFEVRNRQWFESQIDARAPGFYSPQGVAEHIETYLAGFAAGTWHPLVIEDSQGNIVGRANLKDIDPQQRCAEVGYRIDQQACGQGLATLALQQLIHEARLRWALSHLVAYVYEDNIGSKKVLVRCGFSPSCNHSQGPESGFVLAL
ncbi:GNAT family N-acetyltransferase [Pseudomonas chlororaphis]|uniref:GNAT family N-acetyltransferase n=1 Tax=Pseudomonas chlororaphis TaxID=587753 RepID=A0A1Q8ENW6_9PSED|nr:GNAT family N-acetyltransferase [Pseudomonas chlororaphis]OLF53484.1 GNAT family N-acetyltransferase [Pseudomonas chlororaphis]